MDRLSTQENQKAGKGSSACTLPSELGSGLGRRRWAQADSWTGCQGQAWRLALGLVESLRRDTCRCCVSDSA